jgi:hypothetical protein
VLHFLAGRRRCWLPRICVRARSYWCCSAGIRRRACAMRTGWAGVRLTSRRRPKAFCRGERGAARTSSIRIARTRFGKLTPCDVSRSRSRWRGAVCHRKAYPHMPRCPDHLAARLPKEANTNREGSDFVGQLITLAGVENVPLTDANQCVALIMALETHFGRRSSATSWRSPNIGKKKWPDEKTDHVVANVIRKARAQLT